MIGLAVDTDFAAVPPTAGDVSIVIQGATLPGSTGNASTTPAPAPQRRSRFQKRGFFDFIKDTIKKVESIDKFSKDVSTSLPPIDVNKDFTLFDESISCAGSVAGANASLNANIKSDVNAQAHAVITLGASANGTIIPPKISQFALYASKLYWLS